MADPVHLSKAPIVEAVIDLRLVSSVAADRLKDLGKEVGYNGGSEPIYHADIHLNLAQNKGSAAPQVRVGGYKFHSTDRKYIAQFKSDGMTLSRLQPYEDWAKFFAEAQRLWAPYCRVASPQSVTRIAIRNINRIIFPDNVIAVANVIMVPPQLPSKIADEVNLTQWVSRFLVTDKATGMSAFITQVSEPATPVKTLSILLDIDAYHVANLSPDISLLAPLFDRLHALKNRLFFASVTNETIGRYL
jgi:uncharacterized protein (TIGR04255 family)